MGSPQNRRASPLTPLASLHRWGRIKELAQGGTKMRTEMEVASFGVAFVCLCLGIPIGSVGGGVPTADEELKGIQRAREILAQARGWRGADACV